MVRKPGIGDLLAPLITRIIWYGGIQMSIKRRDPETKDIIEDFRRPFLGSRGTERFKFILRWGDPKQVLAKTGQLLPAISASTLIIHGTQDGVIPVSFATRAQDLIPGGHLVSHLTQSFFCDGKNDRVIVNDEN